MSSGPADNLPPDRPECNRQPLQSLGAFELAYVAYPEGTLWRSKADRSECQQLTFPPLFVQLPRWSPDGTHIAFNGLHAPEKGIDVYLIPAEAAAPSAR
jgi:hypothetical protein